MGENELKCKYFDVSNNFHEKFYPTINPFPTNNPYIIITKPDNFMEYVKNDYNGNFLMSQENKKTLLEKEKNEIKKDKKEEEKTPLEKRIVAFKDFVFNDKDFDIVKNENEEEVKTVDQIFYRFVQDEIKDVDNRLRKNMEDWNKRNDKEKTYDNFKNVFGSDYKRKNLFVPDWKVPENNEINIK